MVTMPSGADCGGLQVVVEAAERRVEADQRRQHGAVRSANVELQRAQAATAHMITALAEVEVRA